MRQIFEYCWRYHLIHCSVQVQKSNGDVLIYSYYPFSERSCSDMSPRLINRYNGSALLEPEIFPRKLRNLFGCRLRCALWNVPPFVEVHESESTGASVSGGYEGRLLLALAERMNFSIAVRQLKAKSVRDEALELLRRHEADLTLGGIRQTVDRSLLATSTHNYHQSREVFGILDSSFELSSLDILFYPYRLQIWLAIVGVLALTDYEHLDEKESNLVRFVLDYSLRREEMVPVVLASKLSSEMSVRVQLQLLFVQSPEQAIAACSALEIKGMYLIVWLTSQPEASIQRSTMSLIFGHFLHRLYNLNVLLLLAHMERSTLRAYGFLPYTSGSCASTDPVEMRLQEWRLREMFPFRLGNLHGCPLSVIVWPIAPYMKLRWERRRVKDQIDGLDGVLLRIMATRMNFTIQLMPNEPVGLIGGSSYLNGTMTGAYRMLQDRRANLTLGCAACTPERQIYLTSTWPYTQMPYVIVLKVRSSYSNYEIMLFPFERYTWLLLGGLAIVHRCLRRWGRMPAPAVAGWLLLGFVVRVSYEGSVFNFLHNSPAKPMPHTFEQMVAAGFVFITDHATYRMTLKLPAFKGLVKVTPGQPVDVFDALLKEPPLTGAFTSTAFLATHLTHHKEHRHRFIILAEKILDNMLCMYFPRNSYFSGKINHLLFNMRSFGLFQHHSQRLAWANMPLTTDGKGPSRKVHQSSAVDVRAGFAESMGFIVAALNCLCGALAVGICVFALELLSRRPHWRRLALIMERF
ncbi:GL14588 [Drosophila persimilis]|uniref:GL14588 n=1 Tax=Drosophila persimilis TaxID=7234 RepID=B4GVW8_DROPE|nr:GL14588 [Drosophila persimilis]